MIKATLDMRPVQRAIANAAKGVPVAMRDLRKPLREDQRDHARAQEGPDGAWPKRKMSLAARGEAGRKRRRAKGEARKRRRASRKRLLGRLPGAIRTTSDRSSVTITSKVPWSGIHQDGGTSGRGAKIPARPFLWVSPKLRRIAVALLEQRVVEAFGKAGR